MNLHRILVWVYIGTAGKSELHQIRLSNVAPTYAWIKYGMLPIDIQVCRLHLYETK